MSVFTFKMKKTLTVTDCFFIAGRSGGEEEDIDRDKGAATAPRTILRRTAAVARRREVQCRGGRRRRGRGGGDGKEVGANGRYGEGHTEANGCDDRAGGRKGGRRDGRAEGAVLVI